MPVATTRMQHCDTVRSEGSAHPVHGHAQAGAFFQHPVLAKVAVNSY